MTDRERIAIDKIIKIQRSHVNANIWAEENAVQIMDALKQLGYTCPSEPQISPYEIPHVAYDKYFMPPETSLNKVEAVAKKLWLFHINDARLSDHTIPEFTEADFREQTLIDHGLFLQRAREILKLLSVPEPTNRIAIRPVFGGKSYKTRLNTFNVWMEMPGCNDTHGFMGTSD